VKVVFQGTVCVSKALRIDRGTKGPAAASAAMALVLIYVGKRHDRADEREAHRDLEGHP